MSWQAVRTLIAFIILVVLHYTLRPLLAWRAAADFLMIALLLASVRVRPGVAALIGFAMGIVADSLSLGAFGSAALAMTIVAFVAAWLKAAFFADNLWLNAFFFFLGKWAFDIVYLLSSERVQGAQLAIEMFLWSPLSAAVTAMAGVLMLMILRPLLEQRAT